MFNLFLLIVLLFGLSSRNANSCFFSFFFGNIPSAVVLNNENSSIHIDAVVDPLSPSGQKLSSLLRVLAKYVHPSMRIVLNPLVS